MSQHLFRAEAVNLNPTVYDTADISTIRGGGFYLLSRINALAKKYETNKITEGASMAVFGIDTDDPERIRHEMLAFLYQDQDDSQMIKEMMFLVEYMERQGDFHEQMAQLIGKIRVAQMQTASVRLFSDTFKPSSKAKIQFDQFNQVLPAQHSLTKGDDKKYVSDFTYNRHEQGRDLRANIYKTLLEDIPDLKISDYNFTNELEELSLDEKQGNLNGKIAYIYIDGNKFGALQKEFKTPEEFKAFDKRLQKFKQNLLAGILRLCQKHVSFLKDDQVRLETLLWGGDEIKLIVPAWMGWRVATLFYEIAQADEMNLKAVVDGKEWACELTYAMGLVFTYHKNPVRNVVQIAFQLAEAVKKELKSLKSDDIKYPAYTRTCGNRMHYAVLESLENLSAPDYAAFAQKHYDRSASDLALSPVDMRQLAGFVKTLNAYLSKSSVQKVVTAFRDGELKKYTDALQRALALCEASETQKNQLIGKIQKITGATFDEQNQVTSKKPDKGFRWLQAVELWDYLL